MKAILLATLLVAGPAVAHHLPASWGPDGDGYAAQVSHGDGHLGRGEIAQAVEAYERARRLAPAAWSAAYRLGLAHWRWAERVPARRAWALERAAELAGEATALEPTAVEAWRLLAAAEHARGRPDAALRALRQAAALRGGDAGLLCDLAIAADAAGRRAEAVEAIRRAREIGTAPGDVGRTAAALGVALE